MLKKRIITTLLFDETMQIVKPVAFNRPYRRLGTMMQYIRVIENRNVDELIMIDITATEQKRKPNFEKLREFTTHIFAPVVYGGGISSLDDIRDALNSGADKVAIKTMHELIKPASRKFGSQAIVGVVNTYWTGWAWAKYCEGQGAGEILLTDTNKDGRMNGYNIKMIKNTVENVSIPVIANGGCSSPYDMKEALDCGASAVAAGSLFLFTEHTPRSCAKYLSEKGYEVRV